MEKGTAEGQAQFIPVIGSILKEWIAGGIVYPVPVAVISKEGPEAHAFFHGYKTMIFLSFKFPASIIAVIIKGSDYKTGTAKYPGFIITEKGEKPGKIVFILPPVMKKGPQHIHRAFVPLVFQDEKVAAQAEPAFIFP